MVIPREARRITYSNEIRNLKKLSFSEIQKEVIVGNLLGDGHLCQNWSGTNFRLKIGQAKKQEDYVSWKYDILKDFVLTAPKLHVSTNSVRFATISHPELTNFHNIFYQGKKKIIPKNIGEYLSPLTLAVWFMDDGNVAKQSGKVKGFHLNTQSFTENENLELLNFFHSIDIDGAMEKNHGKYRIGIWRKQSRDMFLEIIKDHILPSMQYKLG